MEASRIADRIRSIREWRNYTQSHMAEGLGVSQNTYSRWERGIGLSVARLERISALLNVTLVELLGSSPLGVGCEAVRLDVLQKTVSEMLVRIEHLESRMFHEPPAHYTRPT